MSAAQSKSKGFRVRKAKVSPSVHSGRALLRLERAWSSDAQSRGRVFQLPGEGGEMGEESKLGKVYNSHARLLWKQPHEHTEVILQQLPRFSLSQQTQSSPAPMSQTGTKSLQIAELFDSAWECSPVPCIDRNRLVLVS